MCFYYYISCVLYFSILNMRPNSEYILTKINNTSDNLQEQEDTINIKSKKHRVELFLNNEYKGVYSLGHIQKKNPNEGNIPNKATMNCKKWLSQNIKILVKPYSKKIFYAIMKKV